MAKSTGSRAFSRDEIRGQLARDQRAQLKEIRRQTNELRRDLQRSVLEARQACLVSVRPALDEVDEGFNATVKRLRGERRTTKTKIRSKCYVNALRDVLATVRQPSADLNQIPGYLAPAVAPYRTVATAEDDLADRRRTARAERKPVRPQRPRRTAGEVLREQDEAVLREIPEDLHALWYRVRGEIKGSKRRSRAEAFLEYVESHPGEVGAFRAERQRDIERELERELAEEQARHAAEEHARRVVASGPRLLGPADPRRIIEAEIEEGETRSRPAKRPTFRSSAKLPVQAIKTFTSAELDDLVERAIMDGTFLAAWRAGDLEVASVEGHVFIAPPGRRVVVIATKPTDKTKAVVERWMREQAKPPKKTQTKGRTRKGKEEGPARPFVEARALPPSQGPRAPLLPSLRFLLPSASPDAVAPPETAAERSASAHVEERDGRVLVRFEERPRVELREQLKRAGFRWWDRLDSNQHPAWVAPISDGARRVAAEVVRVYLGPAPEMSAYEEKRTARIERLKTKAHRLTQEASSTIERARKMADVIPFGQPIHVGHYSEGADRRYRAKIDKTFRKGYSLASEAREAERRARSAERNTAISSDDPDALVKLRAKLAELEDLRALLPQARPALKMKNIEAVRKQLLAIGFDEHTAQRLTPGPPLQRYAYSGFQQNLNGEIQRLRRRIDQLEERAARKPREAEQIGEDRVVEEDNRIRIYFAARPSEEIRKELRSHGFLWAPSVGAWQRKPSESAWYWARSVLRKRAPASSAPPPSSSSSAPPSSSSAPMRLELVSDAPARAESPGRPVSAAERTSSLFGAAGPVPSGAPTATDPRARRSGEPDWQITAVELTPSLFGPRGPVPPMPGERQVRPQTRLPFTR